MELVWELGSEGVLVPVEVVDLGVVDIIDVYSALLDMTNIS